MSLGKNFDQFWPSPPVPDSPPRVSQRAALAALATQEETVKKQVEMYKTRRKLACEALAKIDGLNFVRPEGAYYILVDYPGEVDSMQMSEQLLTEAKVAVVPGVVFGRAGEGQVRIAFAVEEGVLAEGLARLKKFWSG